MRGRFDGADIGTTTPFKFVAEAWSGAPEPWGVLETAATIPPGIDADGLSNSETGRAVSDTSGPVAPETIGVATAFCPFEGRTSEGKIVAAGLETTIPLDRVIEAGKAGGDDADGFGTTTPLEVTGCTPETAAGVETTNGFDTTDPPGRVIEAAPDPSGNMVAGGFDGFAMTLPPGRVTDGTAVTLCGAPDCCTSAAVGCPDATLCGDPDCCTEAPLCCPDATLWGAPDC